MPFDISSSFSVWKVSVLLSSQQLLWSLLAWIHTSFHWVCCLLRETLLSMDSIWSLQSSFFCFASEMASKVSHHCLRRVTPLVGTFPCLCLHPFAPSCVGSPKKQWAVTLSVYTTSSYLLGWAMEGDFWRPLGLEPGWQITWSLCWQGLH